MNVTSAMLEIGCLFGPHLMPREVKRYFSAMLKDLLPELRA